MTRPRRCLSLPLITMSSNGPAFLSEPADNERESPGNQSVGFSINLPDVQPCNNDAAISFAMLLICVNHHSRQDKTFTLPSFTALVWSTISG